MTKRYSDAYHIIQGACNPSGIAHSIIDACQEIRNDPNHTGTKQITSDPAVKIMAYQLAVICGVDGDYGLHFDKDYKVVKQEHFAQEAASLKSA